MTTPTYKSILIALPAALLTACMSTGPARFSCETANEPHCMSLPDVYDATNHAATVEEGIAAAASETRSSRGSRRTSSAGTSQDVYGGAGIVANDGALSLAPSPDPGLPILDGAVRLPAKVMRIWVSPWTDESGDLHMPGHVFTEIEARKWAIGVDAPTDRSSLFDPHGR